VRSCLYDGHVEHVRVTDRPNRFRYPMSMWLIDLDEIESLGSSLRLVGAERPAVHSIRSRDHLGDPGRSIRDNLAGFLAGHGIELGHERVSLLTNPRIFGHVFNPLSVFYCHDDGDALTRVVAEVSNTHGERHCYLLHPDELGNCEVAKGFYVSPFLGPEGEYRMSFPAPGAQLVARVALEQNGARVFAATLAGRRMPLEDATLVRMLVRHPLMTWQISALIRRQGVGLWARGARRFRHRPTHGRAA
jgi:hypothetical protein